MIWMLAFWLLVILLAWLIFQLEQCGFIEKLDKWIKKAMGA